MRSLRLVALLALAVLTPLAASGQMLRSSLEDDSRALLFQLGPTLTPTTFDGSALSYKWHKSNTRAFRLGLGADAEYRSFDSSTEQSAFVEADFLLLTYRRGRTPVYFYYGFGPVIRAQFQRDDLPGASTRFVRASLGAAGILGVEWPLNRVISLLGEYGIAVTGGIDERTGSGGEENGYAATLNSRGGRVGVSVYF